MGRSGCDSLLPILSLHDAARDPSLWPHFFSKSYTSRLFEIRPETVSAISLQAKPIPSAFEHLAINTQRVPATRLIYFLKPVIISKPIN